MKKITKLFLLLCVFGVILCFITMVYYACKEKDREAVAEVVTTENFKAKKLKIETTGELWSNDNNLKEEVEKIENSVNVTEEIEVTEEIDESDEAKENEKEKNKPSNEFSNVISLGEFKLTAYCSCSECCGIWSGSPTASGEMPMVNHTIAVDTSVIPFGTKVMINGNIYIAEDTGSAIIGNRIDIYMSSHNEALNFGVQYAEVFKIVD